MLLHANWLAHGWLTVATLLPGFTLAAQLTATVTNNEGNPLASAVVYLLPMGNLKLPAPRNAEIDQRNRMFEPEVSVVQAGASVSFPNSDNIRHQVYSFSPAKTFNLKLYSGKPAAPVVFDKPGAVVLGCNIHDRMVAWVLVVDTPWFGRTDANGKVTLSAVPDGDYQLAAWHPGQRSELPAVPLSLRSEISKKLILDAAPIVSSHARHDAMEH